MCLVDKHTIWTISWTIGRVGSFMYMAADLVESGNRGVAHGFALDLSLWRLDS
jgi:hypothetical protein